jgi:chemotaxis methyl-accepting protein methylase
LAAKLKTMNEENEQSTPEERREKLEEEAKAYMKSQKITGNIDFNEHYVFDEWLPATLDMIEMTPLYD